MNKYILFLMVVILTFYACKKHNNGVHQHGDDIMPDDHEENDHASHKNEDEKIDYGIITLLPQKFNEVIHTSGEIMAAQGDELTITAKHEGLVIFKKSPILAGTKVTNGQVLVMISGKDLVHDNMESSYHESKTNFENAKTDFERAKELNKDKIISDKEFMDIEFNYKKAQNNYSNIKRYYSSGGQQVSSTISGYIKDVYVSEGQYVTTGEALLVITKNKRLVIKADVPQRYFSKLHEIKTANFKTVYSDEIYNIDDLNGKLISYGRTTDNNSLFTPIYFEIDNKGALLSGSYIDVFLKTAAVPHCFVVPKTAIMEEAGKYFVYVEEDHEYKKRYIKIDCNDGIYYHIAKGLNTGDKVITRNPYHIKLSSLSNALPAHAHSH